MFRNSSCNLRLYNLPDASVPSVFLFCTVVRETVYKSSTTDHLTNSFSFSRFSPSDSKCFHVFLYLLLFCLFHVPLGLPGFHVPTVRFSQAACYPYSKFIFTSFYIMISFTIFITSILSVSSLFEITCDHLLLTIRFKQRVSNPRTRSTF